MKYRIYKKNEKWAGPWKVRCLNGGVIDFTSWLAAVSYVAGCIEEHRKISVDFYSSNKPFEVGQ